MFSFSLCLSLYLFLSVSRLSSVSFFAIDVLFSSSVLAATHLWISYYSLPLSHVLDANFYVSARPFSSFFFLFASESDKSITSTGVAKRQTDQRSVQTVCRFVQRTN